MEITINDDKTLGAIKQEFQEKYPKLKIEFYNHKHQEGEGSPERYLLDDDLTIAKARNVHNEGHVSIHGNLKTSTLESRFQEVYGLNLQVFRQSGELWLQTTSTDSWTLAEQEHRADQDKRNQ